jgi:alkylation response protein AidB-like acyl-CoA dehydrogenase
MDFNFTEDQEQLRDTVRRWVSKDYTFERRNRIIGAGKGQGGYDAAVYNELANLGLCGLSIAPEHDGLGMGAVEAMVVMEELGRGMVMESVAQTLIASKVLDKYADSTLQAAWLPRLASGEATIALAYQESHARYKLDACQATASKASTGYALMGVKVLVAAGDTATAYLVSAKLDGKLALFVVERAGAGVATSAVGLQDGSRAARVSFNAAPAALVTTDGLAALELAVDTGLALLCAEAVGAMDAFVQMTVDYMNTRKQFGQTLSSFQALRFKIADVKMQLELGRSMSYYATLKMDAPADERRAAMARAKYQLGQSMRFVSQTCLQLHGGIGMTDEYQGSHYFKKLTQLEMAFGDSLHHLGEVSGRMQNTAGVFA